MCKITNFNTYEDLVKFVKTVHEAKVVNSGSTGFCLKNNRGEAYKLIEYPKTNPILVDDIITHDECPLDSFLFPEALYGVGRELRGYRSKYIKNDLFSVNNTFDIRSIRNIELNKLSNAYKVMLEDVISLSNEKILIFDMPFNVIFDGDKLYAIDTDEYKRVDYNPLEHNIDSYNLSFELLFKMWFENTKSFNEKIENNDIDAFLDKVYKNLPLSIRGKVNKINKDNKIIKR